MHRRAVFISSVEQIYRRRRMQTPFSVASLLEARNLRVRSLRYKDKNTRLKIIFFKEQEMSINYFY